MVSKRFHTITLNTPALWRYIRLPELSPARLAHIKTRITRSGVVPLIGEIDIHPAQVAQASQVIELISLISSRLFALNFSSCSSGDPVLAFLQITMPQLAHLDITGISSEMDPVTLHYEILPSRFPALKKLVSRNVFNWSNGLRLPQTVEELRLTLCWEYEVRPRRAFWKFLPPKVRTLRLSSLPSHGTTRPAGGKHLLGQLIELTVDPCFDSRELVFLQYLDAPALKTLKIVIDDSAEDMDYVTWGPDFPALERFELKVEGFSMPWLDTLLEHYPSLREVYLHTEKWREEIFEFVEALAAEPALLPNIVHLTAPGSSILSLREVVADRPQLQSLQVHPLDLGLTLLATPEEFAEWGECVEWLEDQVDLESTGQDCCRCREGPSHFYLDKMERYRTWEDMRSGIAIDPRDWQGVETSDRKFWRKYQAQLGEGNRTHMEANGGLADVATLDQNISLLRLL